MSNRKSALSFIIMILLVMSSAPVWAADFYVIPVKSNYKNVIVVAKGGARFSSIQAALNSITDASDTNRYLIQVAPGIYSEQVTMKPYVDITGAGEDNTTISSSGGTSFSANATVVGSDNACLSSIKVLNTGKLYPLGPVYYAVAIYNNGTSPSFFKVTAMAGGASHVFAVYNDAGAAPRMSNMTCSAATASVSSYGVANVQSSPAMEDVIVTASGSGTVYGVHNYDASSPTMTQVAATATGLTGATDVNAVRNEDHSSPSMTQLTANASGGTYACGIYNIDYSSPTMTRFDIWVQNGIEYSHGIYNGDHSNPPLIERGDITVSATSGHTSGVTNDYQCATDLKFSTINVSGGTETNIGFYVWAPLRDVYLSHCDIVVECSESGSSNYGVRGEWGNPLYLDQVNISVSGTTGSHYGVRAHHDEVTLRNSSVYSAGNAAYVSAYNSNTTTVRFSNCQVTGVWRLFDGISDQTGGVNHVYAGSCMLTSDRSAGASAFSYCRNCYDQTMNASTLCSFNN